MPRSIGLIEKLNIEVTNQFADPVNLVECIQPRGDGNPEQIESGTAAIIQTQMAASAPTLTVQLGSGDTIWTIKGEWNEGEGKIDLESQCNADGHQAAVGEVNRSTGLFRGSEAEVTLS